MVAEMLRNSATQAEGIQKILSELLPSPRAGNKSEPQQRAQQRRPRERQRRTELDLKLKVRSVFLFPINILNTALPRPMCVNTLS